MNFHFVHSIKGGCGKSTIAMALAMELNMKNNKLPEEKDEKKKEKEIFKPIIERKTTSCVVDVDFRGTGLEASLFSYITATGQKFIFDDNDDEKVPISKKDLMDIDLNVVKNTAYYNDSLISHAYYNDSIFTKIKYEKHKEEGIPESIDNHRYFAFDICFANPSQHSKNKFVTYKTKTNGSLINHSYFKKSFEKFINFLCMKDADGNERYKDIIFDLPPAYDDYIREIFDVVLDVKGKIAEKKPEVKLYIITNFDMGHIYANMQYLKEMITNYTFKNKLFDNVNIIINDIHGEIEDIQANNSKVELEAGDDKPLYDVISMLNNIIFSPPNTNIRAYDNFDDIKLALDWADDNEGHDLNMYNIFHRLREFFEGYISANLSPLLVSYKNTIKLIYNARNKKFMEYVSLLNNMFITPDQKTKITALPDALWKFIYVSTTKSMNFNLIKGGIDLA